MKEEVIHLSEHLKGLTDGERILLWQALTIDVLSGMLKNDNDELDLVFGVASFGDESHYFAHVARPDESGDTADVLMTWHGQRIPKP
jgi:hypothetical protein